MPRSHTRPDARSDARPNARPKAHSDASPQTVRFGLHALLIGAIWLLVGVGMAISYRATMGERDEATAQAISEQKNVAALLEKHAQHIIASSSSILNRMMERVAERGLENLSGSRADWEWLRAMADDLPSVGVLAIADADGRAVLLSTKFVPSQVTVADREYFRIQREQRGLLHIGETQVGKATGKTVFSMSRRLEDKDGGFAGVVVASVELDYFTAFIKKLELGPGGAVTVLRNDGSVIMRIPDGDAVGKRYPTADVFSYLPHAPEGSYEAPSPIDGVVRLSYYKQVEGLPLVVNVSRPSEEILRVWSERARSAAAMWLSALAVVGGLSAAALLAMRRDRASTAAITRVLARLAASNDQLSSVLNSVGEGICGLDRDGAVTFLNPTAARLLGYEEHEVLGRDLHSQCHHSRADGTDYPRGECPVLATLADGRLRRVDDDVFWRKDGTAFPVEFTATAVHGGHGITGAVLAFRDISERLATENDLRTATEAAEAASRAKSQFLANMSHEIRTPLNAIMGLASLMAQTDLSRKQREYIDKIRTASRSLLGVLNDILDFSKVEAGRLELSKHPFRLDDLMNTLATVVSVDAKAKGIALSITLDKAVPLDLVGDDLRLQQVLINLVGNAVKFTHAGAVSVAVEPVTRGADHADLRFVVRDTGIGMSAEQRKHLFEAFSQGDATMTRRYGGTGLGLAICARLVGLMGGRIAVDSELGKGSCFAFTVGFGCAAAPLPTVEPAAAQSLRILHVSASPAARAVMEGVLRSAGWDGASAASASEAAAALTTAATDGQPFDAVVIEAGAVDPDTAGMIRRIRAASAALPKPPLLVLATTAPEDARAGDACDAVLTSPILPFDLFRTLQERMPGRDAAVEPAAPPPTPSTAHAAPARPLREGSAGRLSGLRILLAEDNALNREVAVALLEREEAAVFVAHDGAQALTSLIRAGAPFDAVLMDVQMPGVDGLEATRRIRALDKGGTLPIIAMTANAMPEDRQRCIEAGMTDHIAKPLDIEQIVAAIHAHVERAPHRPVTGPATEPAMGPADPGDDVVLLAGLPGIDAAGFCGRTGDDGSMLLRLLERFPAEHAEDAVRVRAALARGDRKAAEQTVHTLKGLAGNLSAVRLFREADALTQAMRSGESSPDLAPFDTAFAEVIEACERVRARTHARAPAVSSATLPAVPDLLRDLEQALRANNLAARSLCQTLADALPAALADVADTLVREVECLDFPAARRTLAGIAERLGVAEAAS